MRVVPRSAVSVGVRPVCTERMIYASGVTNARLLALLVAMIDHDDVSVAICCFGDILS